MKNTKFGRFREKLLNIFLLLKVKNGPTYNCTECSCVFKSLGSLNTHISKMHMGGPQNSASSSTDVSHVTAVSFACYIVKRLQEFN